MKLTTRQEQIITITKEHQPVSGEKISEIMGISRATLRSDLSFLTLAGILQATPKIGYTYAGNALEPFFFERIFDKKVKDIMVPPLLIKQDTSIRDAITMLFMYDVGSLYVIDSLDELIGILSRKDLLRASLSSDIDQTPVAVCMTRVPHVKTCTEHTTLLEAASLLQDFEVDSLPVVEENQPERVIGKITKSRILNDIVQQARQTEINR